MNDIFFVRIPFAPDIHLFGTLWWEWLNFLANVLVSDQLLKYHVRWKTEQAKDGYIEDKLESLLSVSKSLPLLSVVWGTLITLFAATSATNQLTHPLIPSWMQLGGLVVRVSLTRFKDWLLRFPRFISHDFLAIAPDEWLKEFQSNFNLSVCVSISLIRKYLRVTVGWSRLSSWLSIDELKSISITIHCCAKKILTQKNLWEIIRKNIKGVSGASGSNFQP